MAVVLVGIDGSERSGLALRWASDLAHALGVPVLPLSVIEHGETLGTFIKQHSHGDVHDLVVADGDPTDALMRVADERDAELIVVGARGHGALRRALMGSTSARLVAGARRPVAVVRRSARLHSRRRKTLVVAATDGSASGNDAVLWAAHAAGATGSSLVVFHAYVPSPADAPPGESGAERDAVRRHLAGRIDGLVSYPYDVVAVEGEPAAALERFSAERKPAMVVLGSRGFDGPKEAFLGSVSRHAVQRLTTPVVLVPGRGLT